MNMTEVTQPSSPNLNTGTGKKGEMTTVGGQFASLLDYLTKLPATLPSPVSAATSNTTELELKTETPPLPDFIQQLVDQPDELLSLLKQPEVETLKHEPKKMEQLLAFVKQLLDGNVEQAKSQFDQLPPSLQQFVLQTVTNDTIKIKEHNLNNLKQPPLPTIESVVSALPIKQTLPQTTRTVETVKPDIVAVAEQVKGKTPLPLAIASLVRKTTMPVDPEGKVVSLPMSMPIYKGATVQQIRPVPLPVPEQIQQRIEAALQQAPFLKGADGSTRLSIRLYPEQLGEVVVQLDRKEGALTVKLFASTEQAKQSIEQQLGKLQTALHQQTPVVKIETGMIASSTRDFQQSFTRDQQEHESPQQETPVPIEEEEEEDDD
ncbi:flagellar hook-length control protein FliK [Exiguobacterium acetylicum]|uniref:flagellar hook-length control protein FliK n=1 Tax=Exiguobacterium acetylicum TaxID=41170 RepID=UPI001EE241EB|nr:flagellar hook-length control protein FliK [Exiguobacterium acetylicum]UKS55009.1 flagellar hook-length control protein FliK [Exiguobacterium acetylicum]